MTAPLFAQKKEYFSKGNFAFEYGNWKPSELDKNPSKPLSRIEGTDYYYGYSITSPMIKSYAFRLSYIYWKQQGLQSTVNMDYVSLRHLSVELKNYMLTESRLCPYVNYGMAAIWSRQVPAGADNKKIKLDRAGFGFNVGAGIDLYLFSHIGVSIEYSYLYARFTEIVGQTDNYSGPKICTRLNLLF